MIRLDLNAAGDLGVSELVQDDFYKLDLTLRRHNRASTRPLTVSVGTTGLWFVNGTNLGKSPLQKIKRVP